MKNIQELEDRIEYLEKEQDKKFNPHRQKHIEKFKEKIKELKNEKKSI